MRIIIFTAMLLLSANVYSREQELRINISKSYTGDIVTDQKEYLASLLKGKEFPGGTLTVNIISNGVRYGGGRVSLTGLFFDRSKMQINSVSCDSVIDSAVMKVPYLPNGIYGIGVNIEGVRYFVDVIKINSDQKICDIELKVDDEQTIGGRIANIPEWAESAFVKHGPYTAVITPEGKYSLKTRHKGRFITVDVSVIHRSINELHRELLWINVPINTMSELQNVEIPKFSHPDAPVVCGVIKLPNEYGNQGFDKLIKNTTVYARRKDGLFEVHFTPKANGEFSVYDILDGEYTISTDGPPGDIPWISEDLSIKIDNGRGPQNLVLVLK